MDAQEARLYIAIIITVVVLGIIIVFFAMSIIRQQRRHLNLQKAYILAELTTMERERSRIAADLHDDIGPILSAIRFEIDSVEPPSLEDKEELRKASAYLDGLINRMREIANDLMPTALSRKGLIPAVKEFIDNIKRPAGFLIDLTVSEMPALPAEKNINIYRICQEVIHNCMKHSGANRLEVKVEQTKDQLNILFRDNGKGFDYPKMLKESNGFGLRSIRNRTELIGGMLTVESKPGKGTAYLMEIALE